MPESSLNKLPPEIPDSFFADLRKEGAPPSAAEGTVMEKLGHPVAPGTWQPQKILYWYDSIIDDMFANPGCSIRETAARLGRSPVTIGLIVRSDLFKARYAQRRVKFNDDLDHRLIGKLARVAELSLDLTVEVMEKKRDSVPLPLLTEIANSAMDRLGYGPKMSEPAPSVVVNNLVMPTSVSPEALASARDKLKMVESRNATARPIVIEGEAESVAPAGSGEPAGGRAAQEDEDEHSFGA